jgi:hypothetical protein
MFYSYLCICTSAKCMSVELKVYLFMWSHNFRFSMSLSLSPNSLYRQTTDCTEGGGLTREHCIAIETFKIVNKTSPLYLHDLITIKQSKYSFRYQNLEPSFVAQDIKVIINTWQQQFIFIWEVIVRSHLIVKLSAICCYVNFGFSFA